MTGVNLAWQFGKLNPYRSFPDFVANSAAANAGIAPRLTIELH